MGVKRGMAYAAAIVCGVLVGAFWGEAYFGHEARAAIGAVSGWVIASLWFESLYRTTRRQNSRMAALKQFEKDASQ